MTQQTHLQRAKEEAREKYIQEPLPGNAPLAKMTPEELDELVTSVHVQTVEACAAIVEEMMEDEEHWQPIVKRMKQSLKQTN